MFETVDKSGRARWVKVYDRIKDMDIDDVITYESMMSLLETDDLATVRQAIYEATKHLQRDMLRTTRVVRGIGYRIAKPNEHVDIARGKHRGMQRSARKALAVVKSADRNRLTPDEKRAVDDEELHSARILEFMKRTNRRLGAHDKKLEQLEEATREDRRLIKGDLASVQNQLSSLERQIQEFKRSRARD